MPEDFTPSLYKSDNDTFTPSLYKADNSFTPSLYKPDNTDTNTGRVLDLVRQFTNTPYVWGGNKGVKGTDCSGMACEVFKSLGVDLPRTAREQYEAGNGKQIKPDVASMKPGDAIFFQGSGGRKGITHVAVYLGDGKYGQMSGRKTGYREGVVGDSLWKKVAGVRRFLPEPVQSVPSMRAATPQEEAAIRQATAQAQAKWTDPTRNIDPSDPLAYAHALGAKEGGMKGFARKMAASSADPRMLALAAATAPVTTAVEGIVAAKAGQAAGALVPKAVGAVAGGSGAAMLTPEIQDAYEKKDWTRLAAALTAAGLSMAGAGFAAKGSVPLAEQVAAERLLGKDLAAAKPLPKTAKVQEVGVVNGPKVPRGGKQVATEFDIVNPQGEVIATGGPSLASSAIAKGYKVRVVKGGKSSVGSTNGAGAKAVPTPESGAEPAVLEQSSQTATSATEPPLTPQDVAPRPATPQESVTLPRTPAAPLDVTGVAKAVTGREPMKGVSREELLAAGQDAIARGVDPRRIADRVLKDQAPMSDDELAAVGVRLRALENQRTALAGEAAAKTTPQDRLAAISQEMEALDADTEALLQAADLSLNKGFHRLGMSAQLVLDKNYSLRDLPGRARAASLGQKFEGMEEKIKGFMDENSRLSFELRKAQQQIADLVRGKKAPRAASARVSDIERVQQYFGKKSGEIRPVGQKIGGRQAGAVRYTLPKPDMEAMQAMRRIARDIAADRGELAIDDLLGEIRRQTGITAGDEQILRMLSDKYRDYMIESDVNRIKANRYISDVKRQAQERLKPPMTRALHAVTNLYDATARTLQAGYDISAPFIQGRSLAITNPAGWAGAWKPMLQSIKNPEVAVRQFANIEAHPMYSRAKAAGLELTSPSGPLNAREEMFANNLVGMLEKMADKRAVTKPIAAVLSGYGRSEAAYTAFLNAARWDTFVKMAAAAPEDAAYLRDVARMVNTASGRGSSSVAKMVGQSGIPSKLIYAPRYKVSQWEMATGYPLLKAETGIGRRQAMKMYAAHAAAYPGLVGLAYLAGFRVDADPRSSDFGKVQWPNGTKTDLFAKPAQAWRLMSQIAYGKISQTGRYEAPTALSSAEFIGSYLQNSAAPIPRAVSEAMYGKLDKKPDGKFKTRPLTGSDVATSFLPLWIQQAMRDGLWQKSPVLGAAGVAGIDSDVGQLADTEIPLDFTKPGQFAYRPPKQDKKSIRVNKRYSATQQKKRLLGASR